MAKCSERHCILLQTSLPCSDVHCSFFTVDRVRDRSSDDSNIKNIGFILVESSVTVSSLRFKDGMDAWLFDSCLTIFQNVLVSAVCSL